MKRIFAVLISVFMLVFALSPAVFADGAEDYPYDTEYYSKFKDKGVKLYVYNWGEYISDGSDGTLDVIGEFEKLTGIDVEYTTFDSNEALYAKLKSGSAGYDVIIPSDYMISRLAESGMLYKLNFENIPNYEKYIDDDFKNPEYDTKNEYSVPYTWGTVGIIYNTKYVDEADVTGWDMLWNEKYSKKILMFDNSRDAFAIALRKLGYSTNTTNEDEIRAAAAELEAQKGVVQAYVMDKIFDKMTQENAYIAPYYAGDFLTMKEDNESLAFLFPPEGTNLFTDAMCIPANAANKEAAEMFINFMCEPVISAANCEATGYSTPVGEARNLIDEEIALSEIAYPDSAVLDNTEKFINLPENINQLMDELWVSVVRTNGLTVGFWIAVAIICVAILVCVFVVMSRKKKRKAARTR